MTPEQLDQTVAYLSDPTRLTLIEAESKDSARIRFETRYLAASNNYPLPNDTTQHPYYVWPHGTNKWSYQLRLYYRSDANVPDALTSISKNHRRPGYEDTNKRIDDTDLIFQLIQRGFVIGDQILGRIH